MYFFEVVRKRYGHLRISRLKKQAVTSFYLPLEHTTVGGGRCVVAYGPVPPPPPPVLRLRMELGGVGGSLVDVWGREVLFGL